MDTCLENKECETGVSPSCQNNNASTKKRNNTLDHLSTQRLQCESKAAIGSMMAAGLFMQGVKEVFNQVLVMAKVVLPPSGLLDSAGSRKMHRMEQSIFGPGVVGTLILLSGWLENVG